MSLPAVSRILPDCRRLPKCQIDLFVSVQTVAGRSATFMRKLCESLQ